MQLLSLQPARNMGFGQLRSAQNATDPSLIVKVGMGDITDTSLQVNAAYDNNIQSYDRVNELKYKISKGTATNDEKVEFHEKLIELSAGTKAGTELAVTLGNNPDHVGKFVEGPLSNKVYKQVMGDAPKLLVDEGQFTFDLEGNNDRLSPYYSRRAHVPSDSSGITIGRGYDLKTKSADQITSWLTAVGVSNDKASLFAQGAGLKGKAARDFIAINNLGDFELSINQQKGLFELSYGFIKQDVQRIVSKPSVETLYGETDWNNLNPAMKDVLVDLRFRGDYGSIQRSTENLQRSVVNNNLSQFTQNLSNRSLWQSVPIARFDARQQYLLQQLSSLQSLAQRGAF